VAGVAMEGNMNKEVAAEAVEEEKDQSKIRDSTMVVLTSATSLKTSQMTNGGNCPQK
jgi:hypothetical protein